MPSTAWNNCDASTTYKAISKFGQWLNNCGNESNAQPRSTALYSALLLSDKNHNREQITAIHRVNDETKNLIDININRFNRKFDKNDESFSCYKPDFSIPFHAMSESTTLANEVYEQKNKKNAKTQFQNTYNFDTVTSNELSAWYGNGCWHLKNSNKVTEEWPVNEENGGKTADHYNWDSVADKRLPMTTNSMLDYFGNNINDSVSGSQPSTSSSSNWQSENKTICEWPDSNTTPAFFSVEKEKETKNLHENVKWPNEKERSILNSKQQRTLRLSSNYSIEIESTATNITINCGQQMTIDDYRLIVEAAPQLESFRVVNCSVEPFKLMEVLFSLRSLTTLDVIEDCEAWRKFTPRHQLSFKDRAKQLLLLHPYLLKERNLVALRALRWRGSEENDYQHVQILKYIGPLCENLVALSVHPAPFIFFRSINFVSLEKLIISDVEGENQFTGDYGHRTETVKKLWITFGKYCPTTAAFKSFISKFPNIEKLRVTSGESSIASEFFSCLTEYKSLKEFHFEDIQWQDVLKHKTRKQLPNALTVALGAMNNCDKVTVDAVFSSSENSVISESVVKEIVDISKPNQQVNLRIWPVSDICFRIPSHIHITPYGYVPTDC